MIKFLLFDIDDTLLDFKKSESVAIVKTFLNHNIILTKEMINDYITINHFFWDKFEKGEIEKENIGYMRFKVFIEKEKFNLNPSEISEEYFYELSHNPFYIEGALELLNDLKDEYEIYLVSNGVKKVQDVRLKLTGLISLVKGVFVSEEIGYNKPDPKYFEHVFKNIPNFNLNESLLIGDSLTSDIKGANNVGLKCVYFKHNDNDYSEYKIDYIINNLYELYDILKK